MFAFPRVGAWERGYEWMARNEDKQGTSGMFIYWAKICQRHCPWDTVKLTLDIVPLMLHAGSENVIKFQTLRTTLVYMLTRTTYKNKTLTEMWNGWFLPRTGTVWLLVSWPAWECLPARNWCGEPSQISGAYYPKAVKPMRLRGQ